MVAYLTSCIIRFLNDICPPRSGGKNLACSPLLNYLSRSSSVSALKALTNIQLLCLASG